MSIDLEEYSSDQLTKQDLIQLIDDRKSFRVVQVTSISTVVGRIEEAIESQGLRCRVYTEYRSAALSSAVIPTGVTQAVGLFSAIGIGLHNLVTYNPVMDSVTVVYKKS
ncbi:hypothetical protein MTZ49_07400 [Entomomonas sp. E2T0]|uniref:hypothetical protein n=1 Tax=Entomomonas sp. E2T0 TaxID=2930213 RepID=UPI0022283767|nr:hypothetical protein [Entomomonas sp. E2T0]UYZ85364.1 hypothetical protein MTZ49_07400 [Entomomonas sp. E2T0]